MKQFSKKEKKQIIEDFRTHVSSGKVAIFEKYKMDIVMGEREGVYFWDITGSKKLINCHSNGGVFNLGHRNPNVIASLHEATKDYDIGNHHFISNGRAALAKKIASLTPGDLDCTVFGVSGGEAIDLAIKLARGYTKRNEIVSIEGGYHGHTGFALAAGDEAYRAPFGKMSPGFIQVPFNDTAAMKKVITGNTAAVILETIPATMGMVLPDEAYLKSIRKFCDETGALLILDEVQSGLGRTGKLWAFEYFDIIPDIFVAGKGLSGGIYPITATVFRTHLESFFNEHPFIHVSTFGGSEIGAKVALKVLELSSNPTFLDHVNDMAILFKEAMQRLQIKHSKYIKGFNQLGLMMGIVFKDEDLGVLFTKAAYECGMFALYSNNDKRITQLLPPLIIEEEQVNEVIDKIDKATRKLSYYRTLLRVKNAFGELLP
ncbi:aspartate aminotransferase family protein [Leptobacterium sp. I13]|uniref:aspartate aminotransferase family protein n=1 Tax=Leptobacterium meishanense TaxID=3128904 RepID=UPI0030EF0F0F